MGKASRLRGRPQEKQSSRGRIGLVAGGLLLAAVIYVMNLASMSRVSVGPDEDTAKPRIPDKRFIVSSFRQGVQADNEDEEDGDGDDDEDRNPLLDALRDTANAVENVVSELASGSHFSEKPVDMDDKDADDDEDEGGGDAPAGDHQTGQETVGGLLPEPVPEGAKEGEDDEGEEGDEEEGGGGDDGTKAEELGQEPGPAKVADTEENGGSAEPAPAPAPAPVQQVPASNPIAETKISSPNDNEDDKQDSIEDKELPPSQDKEAAAAPPPDPDAEVPADDLPAAGVETPKVPASTEGFGNDKADKGYKCFSASKSRRMQIDTVVKVSPSITEKYGPCLPRVAAQIESQLHPFHTRGIHPDDIHLAFHDLQYQERSMLIRKVGTSLYYLMPSSKENAVVNVVCQRIADSLLSTLSKVSVSNFELVLRLGYRPVAPRTLNFLPRVGRRHEYKKPVPVFSLATTDAHWDINWPNNVLPKIKNWTLSDHPWSAKTSKAVWRGTTKGLHAWMFDISKGLAFSPRGALVLAGQANPGIIDAGFTEILADHRYLEARLPTKPPIDYKEQLQYKILTAVDGMGFIGHYRTFMASNSLALKVKSPLYEFWYPGMTQQWNSVQADPQDTEIAARVRWLLEHDAEAEAIAAREKLYVRRLHSAKFIECYTWKLLHMYSKLFRYDTTSLDYSTLAKYWQGNGQNVSVSFDKGQRTVEYSQTLKTIPEAASADQEVFIKKCQNVLALGKPS